MLSPHHRTSPPALKGGVLALLSALMFGISTPLIQHASQGIGPFTTASLIYLGAAIIGLLSRRPEAEEASLSRADLPRLGVMALLGAAIAPAALAWGLQHTSGSSASLLLTLEAIFSALFAWLLYRETVDKRVLLAMALILAGAMLLITEQGHAGNAQLWGLLAVLLATLAWGADNALSKPLSQRDPSQVVLAKALLGISLTACLAWRLHEPLPTASVAFALCAIGAGGYGLSLRLYLLAQRALGAGRTASVFAFAPFIGAATALAMGERGISILLLLGGLCMLLGVILHLIEHHDHEHQHDALEHEHAHRHDDGHHAHFHPHDDLHEHSASGTHNHRHHHAAIRHAHPHVPDAHHQHRH